MEWVEVRGETLEQAKEEALDQLGVASDDAEFEIVQEPETRWLGIKKTEARVRARVRPTQPRPKRDARGNRRQKRGDGRGGSNNRQRGDRGAKSSQGKSNDKRRGGQTNKGQTQNKQGAKDQGRTDQAESTQRKSSSSSGSKNSGTSANGRTKNKANAGKEESVSDQNASASSTSSGGGRSSSGEQMPLEQQKAAVVEFLDGLAGGFGLEATASTEMDDDVIIGAIDGSDLGLMIGPKGGTMHAIQELARSAVQRQSEGRDTSRLMIDVAGYRARRRSALADFTKTQAETVLSTGEDLALEPMGSADRKAIHDAAVEIDGIRSISEGDEPRRRVVLIADKD